MLFSIFFTTNVRIAAYFVYYKYMNHNKENVSIHDYVYQPKNYNYKWEKLNKLILKIELIIFTMTLLISKTLMQDISIYNIGYITIKKIDDCIYFTFN